MKKRSVVSSLILFVVILVCGVVFSGCRRSEVLEQKIYTENQQTDWENDTKVKNNDEENTNEDQEITSRLETQDAQTERNQTNTKPVEGSGDNNGSTPQIHYAESASSGGEAEASAEGIEQGNDTTGVGITDTAEVAPASSGELETVEENGEEIVIPDSYSKISAVGPAAVFVEILGGSGKLKASSESFTGSTTAQSLFSDIQEVEPLWTGDGSTEVTDENLGRLITLLTADNSGKGACLYDTGTISSAQIQILKEAGIDTYPINLVQNSSSAYKEQVMAIGEILGGDAVNRAKDYCDWYDRILGTAESGAVEMKYTLFVSGWDGTASWQIADRSGTGLAVAPSESLVKLFDEYLSAAGVRNSVTRTFGELGQPRNWYVNPLHGNGAYSISLIGTSAEILKEDEKNKLTSIYADGIYLGSESGEFPSVIAADSAVAQRILDEKNSGSGLWTDYGMQKIVGGSGYGLMIGDSLVQSTIHGDYGVYALPQGIAGNWASGTPEGVLASMWASNKFGGSVTEDNLIAELRYFYQTFCGAAVSDDQLSGILTG